MSPPTPRALIAALAAVPLALGLVALASMAVITDSAGRIPMQRSTARRARRGTDRGQTPSPAMKRGFVDRLTDDNRPPHGRRGIRGWRASVRVDVEVVEEYTGSVWLLVGWTEDGRRVLFGAHQPPAAHILEAMERGECPEAFVESWQILRSDHVPA